MPWEDLEDDRDADFAVFAALLAGYELPTPTERLASWRPPWMASAACKGAPVATFFPASRGPGADAEAKTVCSGCEVRSECFAFASEHGELGVWGGASPGERRALRTAG